MAVNARDILSSCHVAATFKNLELREFFLSPVKDFRNIDLSEFNIFNIKYEFKSIN